MTRKVTKKAATIHTAKNLDPLSSLFVSSVSLLQLKMKGLRVPIKVVLQSHEDFQ